MRSRRVIPPTDASLADRLREGRRQTFDDGEVAEYARVLGLTPARYRAYEGARRPPPEVLLRISRVTGVDLRWLITGSGTPTSPTLFHKTPYSDIIDRFAGILGRAGDPTRALACFVDLVEDYARIVPAHRAPPASLSKSRLIPVFGRTAAGVPQFWHDARRQPDFVTTPAELAVGICSATASLLNLRGSNGGGRSSVNVLQLPDPIAFGELSVAEFLASARFRRLPASTFALRVDGDSMAPTIIPGDWVLVAPNRPAHDGKTAVVQLRRQIGVTCKLYRREGAFVRLIPINESFPITAHAVDDVVWALAVLYRVRSTPRPL